MSRTAIIAGQGALPAVLAAMLDDPLVYALEGFAPQGVAAGSFRLERLVPFLEDLARQDVTRVTFAGAIRRPRLEPGAFDTRTAQLVPRILMAMQSGDDAALREVIAVFEEAGFEVASTARIAPSLVPGAGVLAGAPDAHDEKDAIRAAEIVAGLGALDVGQGAVVVRGLCLAIESLPGTAAMIDFAAEHRHILPGEDRAGLLFKAPKPGQDLRIDLPTIGPDTVVHVARAGLRGIAWQAGGVILLDRDRCIAEADEAGLFLWARD